ncbi:unnamed protein product [Arctogadus glacialis]
MAFSAVRNGVGGGERHGGGPGNDGSAPETVMELDGMDLPSTPVPKQITQASKTRAWGTRNRISIKGEHSGGALCQAGTAANTAVSPTFHYSSTRRGAFQRAGAFWEKLCERARQRLHAEPKTGVGE